MNQEEQVLYHLQEYGDVSRNWALSQNITRLSAIIQDLEAKGFVFDADYKSTEYGDNDYLYVLIQRNYEKDKPQADKQQARQGRFTFSPV